MEMYFKFGHMRRTGFHTGAVPFGSTRFFKRAAIEPQKKLFHLFHILILKDLSRISEMNYSHCKNLGHCDFHRQIYLTVLTACITVKRMNVNIQNKKQLYSLLSSGPKAVGAICWPIKIWITSARFWRKSLSVREDGDILEVWKRTAVWRIWAPILMTVTTSKFAYRSISADLVSENCLNEKTDCMTGFSFLGAKSRQVSLDSFLRTIWSNGLRDR